MATVVIGPDGAQASHYAPNSKQRRPLALRPVGTFEPDGDSRGGTDGQDARQVLALGAAGNAVLRDLVVGVVGLGGLGSHVSTQLSHLGVRRIVGVDFDRVEPSNLSRLVGSRRRDALLRRRKTAVGHRVARRLGAGFKPINGRVEDPAVARELLECDVVVGCTDNQSSRAVLNRLALQFYVPVLDLGVQIRPGGSSGGRATWLLPDSPCEWCRGILDPDVVRAEQLPAHLREVELERGYIADMPVDQPAVVSVNGVVASLGVTELVARCTTALGDNRGEMLVYRLGDGTVRRVGAASRRDCATCNPSGNLGAGDLVELL
ncbi:MAG: ThiF family adenylyltransferase [Actinobacteria bacterium]|nr:ThiF family adenylyltransferase [Actinomycetota bacterium]